MRIGRVRVHRHDHWLLLHPFLFVTSEHELRDVPFRRWFVGPNASSDFGKSILNNAMHLVRSFHLHLVLLRRKHRLEPLHQYRAGNGFNFEGTNEFDCPRIHP